MSPRCRADREDGAARQRAGSGTVWHSLRIAFRLYTHPFGGVMADVNIYQTPTSTGGGGASWALALVVIILLAIIAWFVFGGGLHKTSTTKVEISTPGAAAPAAPPAPAAAAGGGAPKTPYPVAGGSSYKKLNGPEPRSTSTLATGRCRYRCRKMLWTQKP